MNIDFIYDKYTDDGLKLPMVHFCPKNKSICVIFIHGMCGSIVDNYFATVWGKKLSQEGIGFIYEHNRGHDIENDIVMKDGSFKRIGCMYEIFEDSKYDIDLAIKTAIELGYKKIVLLGHSYGCNKVIYYNYVKNPNIFGIILASAPDMIGSHFEAQLDHEELLLEAKKNIEDGNNDKLLHKKVEDYMYMSSKTYYNWYNKDSNLNNLPVIENPERWDQLEKIKCPILTFSGSDEEDYYQHLDLIKEKAINCKNFEYYFINETGHTYKRKEEETAEIIKTWIKNLNI